MWSWIGVMEKFLFLLLLGSSLSTAVELPAEIKPCKADETINECVLKASKTAIPLLAKGDKKWKIPVLDPFRIEKIHIQEGTQERNHVNITLSNVDLIGFKNAKMTSSQIDLKKKKAKLGFVFEPLQIVSDYDMTGQFLLVPIIGNGRSRINVEKMTAFYWVDYTLKKVNGVEYIELGTPDQSFNLTKVEFNFENLFNGNKQLGDNINQMLNDNWRDATRNVGPAMARTVVNIITNILQSVAKDVPFKQFFAQK